MSTCAHCGADIEFVPIDPEGDPYPLCTNPECVTNNPPDDFDDESIDTMEEYAVWPDATFPDPDTTEDYPALPVTSQMTRVELQRIGLEVFRAYTLALIQGGHTLQARQFLESVINMFLHDNRIPHGRYYATQARELGLGMRGMALNLLELASNNMDKLEFLTKVVFSWLMQTEEDLKRNLSEQIGHLIPAAQSQISVHKNIPEAARLIWKITIIKKALDNIDREGSPPVIGG